jgi:predicted thioredoxin/glutaredoxin
MPFERVADVTFEVFDGLAVLVDPRGVEMITLNRVGTLVWQELDRAKTVNELVAAILPTLAGTTADELERDIRTFLQELVGTGLVVTTDDDG